MKPNEMRFWPKVNKCGPVSVDGTAISGLTDVRPLHTGSPMNSWSDASPKGWNSITYAGSATA